MPTGLDSIRAQRRADGKEHRGLFVLSAVVFLLLLVFQVCYRGKDAGFVNPLDALVNIVTWVRLSFSDLFSLSYYDSRDEIIAGLNYYAETVIRLRSALLIIASGAVLAVSGCIYQAAMRNSMAVPTMLGVSSGVNLGKILLVWQFGEQVYFLTTQRYIYCYGIAAAVLAHIVMQDVFGDDDRAVETAAKVGDHRHHKDAEGVWPCDGIGIQIEGIQHRLTPPSRPAGGWRG